MGKKRLRPPIKYHGGKYYLCEWIIQHFPDHDTYVEPFGGAASVLLNKARSEIEIYMDLDYRIYNLMRQLQEQPEMMLDVLSKIRYEKEPYLKMRAAYRSEEFEVLDPFNQAILTYCVARMSRGGLGGTFCWSNRVYGEGIPGEVHGWLTALEQLPAVCERLQGVRVMHARAEEMVEFDGPTTLFYLDPPYPKETRTFKKAYRQEMTTAEHRQIAQIASKLEGTVILSSYPSKLYDELYLNWERVEKEVPNHSSQERRKEKKREVLWMKNPKALPRK